MGAPSRSPKPRAATGIIGKVGSGTRYAIIIGISDYPGSDHIRNGGYDLSYADDHAPAIYNTLTTACGSNSDNIHLTMRLLSILRRDFL